MARNSRGRPMARATRVKVAKLFIEDCFNIYKDDFSIYKSINKFAKKLSVKSDLFKNIMQIGHTSGLTYMQREILKIQINSIKYRDPFSAFMKTIRKTASEYDAIVKSTIASDIFSGTVLQKVKKQKVSLYHCKYDEDTKSSDEIKQYANVIFASNVSPVGPIAYIDDTTYFNTTNALLNSGYIDAHRLHLINAGELNSVIPDGVTHIKQLFLEYFASLPHDKKFGGIYIDATQSLISLGKDLMYGIYHCAADSCLAITYSYRGSGKHETHVKTILTMVASAATGVGLHAILQNIIPNRTVLTYIWKFKDAS